MRKALAGRQRTLSRGLYSARFRLFQHMKSGASVFAPYRKGKSNYD